MLALAETIGWSDPLTPAEKPFSLFIGENDLTAYVDRDSYDLEDPGGTQPATLAVVLTDVQNLVGLGVTQRSRMRWMDNVHDRTLFDGFVKLIEPNGVANYAEWQVTASHVEAVLDGLFIPSAARPAEDTDVRMQALLASCLPAAAPLAFGAGGHLGVTGGQDEATYANQTLRAVLESVLAGGTAKATGYFIDPQDWSLHTYEGTDSGLAAPYEISDAETAGRSYRDTLMNLGPLAYWRLGETSGTVMRDETGNYPGTYGTADTLDQAGLLPNDPSSSILVTSSVGHGHIDGVASSASQMSISLVVGIGIHAGSDMLVSRNWNNGAGAWLVYLSFAGFPAFYVNVDGTATKNVTAPTIAGPGTHHIVATYDDPQLKLYVDGAYIGSIDVPGSVALDTSSPIALGAPSLTDDVSLQEVALFDRALDAGEVAALYAARNDDPTSVPAALDPQADASTEVDAVFIKGGNAAGSGVVWVGQPKWPAICAQADHPESVDATTLAAVGKAELEARNGIVRLQAVVTGYDGWLKGQVVNVTNVALGYDHTPFVVTGVSIKALSGEGLLQYTLQLGNGPLRLTTLTAQSSAQANQKVTGAQLAAGTVQQVSFAGGVTFDDSDSGFLYFTIPNLGNGYTVVEAFLNTHFRQFWAPAKGTGTTTAGSTTPPAVTSASTTPGGVTSASGGGSHGHTLNNHIHQTGQGASGSIAEVAGLRTWNASGVLSSGSVILAAANVNTYTSLGGGGGTTLANTPTHQHSVPGSSHTHDVPGATHSHSVPAAPLTYGMFLEDMPASWSVTIALEFYSAGTWSPVATFSGITSESDLMRDLSPYVTEPGEYRLNLRSDAGQPNDGRLVADVFGYVAVKLL